MTFAEASTNFRRIYCVFALPESTFISEYYLRSRQVEEKTRVVPIYDFEEVLSYEI